MFKLKQLHYLFCQLVVFLLCLNSAYAFTCRDYTGQILNSANDGTLNVNVNLQPQLELNQNLVVNLANSISCKNDEAGQRNDNVSMLAGSAYGGALANFTGSLKYYGASYPFPLTSATASRNFLSGTYESWNTQIYLTPTSSAGGVAIRRGEKFATVIMYQVGSDLSTGGNVATARFTWNLIANNDVIIPTGGCDVSSRDVTVNLPEYPGSASVPISIFCAKNQNISFFLSGSTLDAEKTIFKNTASSSPSQNMGVQLTRNGVAIPANNSVSLGTVSTSPVNLGLTATYARSGGQVTAGNVQSIIGVTFVYD